MTLTEEEKRIIKKYYEMTNSILEQKLALFHITNKFSDPEINNYLKEIESNDAEMEDFILKKLDFSNAQKRFKSIELTEPAKNKKPDKKMNEYLTEAFWCYAVGMFNACVALCRTAIEIGIKDQLNDTGLIEYTGKNCDELIQEEKKRSRKWEDSLKKLITRLLAQKGISSNKRKELDEFANCIRIKGNIVVHSQKNMEIPDREKETLDVLLKTRYFLAEIYSIM